MSHSGNLGSNVVRTIRAALQAGDAILEVYDSEFAVEHKEDRSPLTLADKRSHEIIATNLGPTNIPILSEEGREIPYDERRKWERSWVVDPLDGTKEFVKRNGEFTVNIALVENGRPILGTIYVPVTGLLYFALKGTGSYRIADAREMQDTLSMETTVEKLVERAEKLPAPGGTRPFTVVGSRSHMSTETEEYIDKLKKTHGEISVASRGSSLKLCMVAEGAADIYPRFAPTMEWDTAAGQAVVEQAGGKVLQTNEIDSLAYNKEDLLNPWFVVKAPQLLTGREKD